MALTQVDQGMLGTYAQYTGFKNRIINGAMAIAQYGTSSVTPTAAGYFSCDRWRVTLSVASKFSIQQSTTAPAGFNFSTLITSASAYSVGAAEQFAFTQFIEGYNTSDLMWGTSDAQTVTLSFWVRSSLTGTFGGVLKNSANDRSYPFTYTISSANTWEYETITIAGDTSGTWIGATNGIGLRVQFSLGTGSTLSTTAGAWASGNYSSATGAVSVVGTSGATFYITGVQLEKGSTATSFDYRPYGTELQLCQRYYWKIFASTGTFRLAIGSSGNTTSSAYAIKAPVTMRTTPTIGFSTLTIDDGGSPATVSAISFSGVSTFVDMLGLSVTSTATLTTGRAAILNAATSGTSYIDFSSEL
jgi:hypothetical protein